MLYISNTYMEFKVADDIRTVVIASWLLLG